jgi:DNA-binding NarL/FixJ family response regulator
VTIRILLVDDHQMMRDGLRSVLASDPEIEVIGEAADGRTAIELTRKLGPDLVVMDIGMREMNGIDATQRIKTERPGVKVIALSTYTDRRYVLRALEAGASGYVAKVSAFDELQRAVKAVAEGGSYLSPEVADLVVGRQPRQPSARRKTPYETLGAREREVLQLLAEGLTSGEIAERLHLSTRTVDTHRRNIMRKLGLHSVAELTKFAVREGLTALES